MSNGAVNVVKSLINSTALSLSQDVNEEGRHKTGPSREAMTVLEAYAVTQKQLRNAIQYETYPSHERKTPVL